MPGASRSILKYRGIEGEKRYLLSLAGVSAWYCRRQLQWNFG